MSSPSASAAASEGPSRTGTALQVPAFRLLWINQLTFFFVSNGLRFVYGWVAIDGLGKQVAEQSLVIFALGIPSIFLLLPAGVWADRLDRRRMLIGTQLALALVMFGTAIAIGNGAGSMPILFVSALAAGAATAVGSPIRSSLVPELLPKDLLVSGIAFGALAMTLSLVLGALTARFAGDLFGFDGSFYYLLALLVIGIGAIIPMRVPDHAGPAPNDAGPAATGPLATDNPAPNDAAADNPDPQSTDTDAETSMRAQLRDAIDFVWEHRALRSLFILLAVSGLIMTPMMFVTLQAFIEAELDRKAGDAAILFALMGLGLAGASLVIIRRGNMEEKGVKFMRAMLLGTSTLFLMGRATAFWQLMALTLFMGLCGGFFINMNQSLVQANVPQHLMGRVMGLYTLVQAGFTPIGALIIGAIASGIGVGLAISVCSAVGFAVVVWTYLTASELRTLT